MAEPTNQIDATNRGFRPDQLKGIVPLAAALGAISLLWLAVLPWIAQQPPMKSHLHWLEARKIDPSAMFYTDLEVMDDILRRQLAKERRTDSPRNN